MLCLTLGIALSIPTIPGPGFVFVLLGIILADFPFKHHFVNWLRHKAWFRRARAYLRRRWNLLLMLGEPWHDEIVHPELAQRDFCGEDTSKTDDEQFSPSFDECRRQE